MILGLDIGGANLKAADTLGAARTWSFPLWKAPEQLSTRLRDVRRAMPNHTRIAVTMTGELCDCYPNKSEGVRRILEALAAVTAGLPVRVWTSDGTLVSIDAAQAQPLKVAGANCLALAHLAVGCTNGQPALSIDVGSTTTDICYLANGIPQPLAATDRGRLASGELVYTGLRRTPICAVLGSRVAAEFFATMLDAYLVLGLAAEDPANNDTADARPVTREHAHARLARLRCADAAEFSAAEAANLARLAVNAQLEQIATAVERVLDGRAAPRTVIASGSGEVIVRQLLAKQPRLTPLPLIAFSERLGPARSEAACAYSLALLAAEKEWS